MVNQQTQLGHHQPASPGGNAWPSCVLNEAGDDVDGGAKELKTHLHGCLFWCWAGRKWFWKWVKSSYVYNLYIYICMYIYMYIYICNVCIYIIYIIYIYMYVYICICVYIYIHIHIYICVSIVWQYGKHYISIYLYTYTLYNFCWILQLYRWFDLPTNTAIFHSCVKLPKVSLLPKAKSDSSTVKMSTFAVAFGPLSSQSETFFLFTSILPPKKTRGLCSATPARSCAITSCNCKNTYPHHRSNR